MANAHLKPVSSAPELTPLTTPDSSATVVSAQKHRPAHLAELSMAQLFRAIPSVDVQPSEYLTKKSSCTETNADIDRMKTSHIISDWKNYITVEQGLAATSISTYKSNLNRYVKYLATRGLTDPDITEALTYNNFRNYLYHLRHLPIKARSVHGAFDAVESFVRYCLECGIIPTNPLDSIKLPKKNAPHREIVTDAEVASLFEAAGRQVKPQEIALSKVILSLLCYTGVRISELVNLKVGDIFTDAAEPMLVVRHGKGDKARDLYLSLPCQADLKAWLVERSKMQCTHPYLICQYRTRRVSDEWIRAEIKRIKAIAGFSDHDNIAPHALRHWFASNMHRRGGTLKQVQIALGHSQISTTAIYVHGSGEDAKMMATLSVLGDSNAAATQRHEERHSAEARHITQRGPHQNPSGAPQQRLRRVRQSRSAEAIDRMRQQPSRHMRYDD